jgi:sortase A
VAGALLVAYAAAVVFWRDPVTEAYTVYQQRGLRSGLARETENWHRRAVAERPAAATPTPAAELASVRRLARLYGEEHMGHDGKPLGRLVVPGMGLRTVFVEGTDSWSSLTKGPGRYDRTAYPGLGRTVAIAGHRTTFSAPFRHIDSLDVGDPITLEMPYGTFRYEVVRHRIVDNGDWSIVRETGRDTLVLSACHPLYSAEQRYVVFARLDSVTPAGQRRSIRAA